MTPAEYRETLAEPIAEAYRRMPDPVLLTSNDGLIVFVNPAAETLYAYSSAELSRKPLSLIDGAEITDLDFKSCRMRASICGRFS